MSTLRMEKEIIRLFRLSTALCNRKILLHYKLVKESTQYMSYKHSTNVQDASETQNSKVCHSLLDPIKSSPSNCINPIIILNKIKKKDLWLEPKSILEILEDLHKSIKVDKSLRAIIKVHLGFKILCGVIYKNLRSYNTHDIIDIYKTLMHLNIPVNNILYQSLLQYLRVSINELDIQQLSFICFLIRTKEHEENALSNALRIAVPIVLQTQFESQVKNQSLKSILSIMKYASTELKPNHIEALYVALLKEILQTEGKYMRSYASHFADIYIEMIEIGHLDSHISKELISSLQRLISEYVNDITTKMIYMLLKKISISVASSKSYIIFYNEQLVDKLIGAVLLRDMTFDNTINILSNLNVMQHVSIPFLDYVAAECFKNKTLLRTFPMSPLIFLNGLIAADYKPVFWNSIASDIVQLAHIRYYSHDDILRFATYLVALDLYDSNILQKVFSIVPLSSFQLDYISLLYQAVKTMYPTYQGPWPTAQVCNACLEKNMDHSISSTEISTVLKQMLQEALGGEQYVLTNLVTKLGHHIDFAIVMRKGGYPVAINVQNKYSFSKVKIEDLNCPPGSQIILLYIMPCTAYSRNSERLISTWLLKLRSAEALLGCSSIALNGEWWYKLPNHEKIPYLMQAIKLKCND